jgi:hypothetical protein
MFPSKTGIKIGSRRLKGDSDPLSIGAVGPGTLDHRTESAQGYLTVYSATDEFNDGGLAYYSHSSYAIYTIDGELSTQDNDERISHKPRN